MPPLPLVRTSPRAGRIENERKPPTKTRCAPHHRIRGIHPPYGARDPSRNDDVQLVTFAGWLYAMYLCMLIRLLIRAARCWQITTCVKRNVGDTSLSPQLTYIPGKAQARLRGREIGSKKTRRRFLDAIPGSGVSYVQQPPTPASLAGW